METTQEILIIDKVKEVEARYGKELFIDLTKVSALANKAALITDPKTEDDFLQVTETRKKLAKYRKDVFDYFMSARTEFNRLSKGVIEVQNVVLDTFVPEEERMKAFESARKEEIIRAERLEALPAKKERLAAIGDGIVTPDELILVMEDAEFEIYIVGRQGDKNEFDRVEIEEAKAKVEADIKKANEELEAKKAEDDRVEKARQEERDKAIEKLQMEKDKIEADKQKVEDDRKNTEKYNTRVVKLLSLGFTDEGDNFVFDERLSFNKVGLKESCTDEYFNDFLASIETHKANLLAEEAKKKADQEANEKYQAWLKQIGYSQENHKLFTSNDGSVEAYKLVGIYKV